MQLEKALKNAIGNGSSVEIEDEKMGHLDTHTLKSRTALCPLPLPCLSQNLERSTCLRLSLTYYVPFYCLCASPGAKLCLLVAWEPMKKVNNMHLQNVVMHLRRSLLTHSYSIRLLDERTYEPVVGEQIFEAS